MKFGVGIWNDETMVEVRVDKIKNYGISKYDEEPEFPSD